jgi:hypothetical protein
MLLTFKTDIIIFILTRKESIEATGKVRTECNKVCIMSLFHIPTTKPMRLEEFEQTQSQASSQVSYMFFGINFIHNYTCVVMGKKNDVNLKTDMC